MIAGRKTEKKCREWLEENGYRVVRNTPWQTEVFVYSEAHDAYLFVAQYENCKVAYNKIVEVV